MSRRWKAGWRSVPDRLPAVLPYFIGWLVIMVAFLVTQTRFYDAHQRTHGKWRAHGKRHATPRLFYSPTEYRAMLRATFQRDDDPAVETARRLYLLVLGVAIAYLLGIPLFSGFRG